MITDHDIARWRLRNQRVVAPHAADVLDVVGSLLAVQAENPHQSAWALASRTREPRQRDVSSRLEDGQLIRTHVLRPTWHYVRAEDVGWLLDLTGPRVRVTVIQQLNSTHGMYARELDRARTTVMDALAARPDLTRTDVAATLQGDGLEGGGNLVMLLMAHLELDGLVCSGQPRDGEHTYARVEDRIPNPRRLDRDEALAELAWRYFTGHGPATERDLAYWATLTLTDVRRGLSLVRDGLGAFEHDGRTFWHAPDDPPRRPGKPQGHLLQILDELYRGYQDSRWVLDAAGAVPRTRETAIGMAVVDAQLVATMRRSIGTDTVTFRLKPYRSLGRPDLDALWQAASRYGDFLGLDARIDLG